MEKRPDTSCGTRRKRETATEAPMASERMRAVGGIFMRTNAVDETVAVLKPLTFWKWAGRSPCRAESFAAFDDLSR
jgi:hypothetical protein